MSGKESRKTPPKAPDDWGTEPEGDDASAEEMTLLEHLDDLRVALGRSVLVFFLAVGLLALFLPQLTEALRLPYDWAQQAESAEELRGLLSIRPMGVFTVVIQVLFLGGLALSLPFILYFVSAFIAPALTAREKRILAPGLAAGFVLFLVGASFAFFLLLPATLRVSMYFNQVLGLELLWNASDYYNLVVWMTVLVGAIFEFPLVLVVLSYTGVVSVAAMRAQWRIVITVILILSALITPGDPVTLFIMAIPLFGLFLLSLAVGARLERRRAGPSE